MQDPGNTLIDLSPRMKRIIVFVLTVGISITGCANSKNRSKGVYMLLDTSGTGVLEMKNAQAIIHYLLLQLQPNDTLAVARIDTESFSERDIVGEMTFNQRPSIANAQKRAFRQQVDNFSAIAKSSMHSDLLGGILHATEYLNRVGSGKKYILIFTDLNEEIARENISDVPFQLAGFQVVAFSATPNTPETPKNPVSAQDWRTEVENNRGIWHVVNHLESLKNIFGD
jgi:hypothetical protein